MAKSAHYLSPVMRAMDNALLISINKGFSVYSLRCLENEGRETSV